MRRRQRKTQALQTWDEELAQQAEAASAMEASAGGGQFFSTRAGVLQWQDQPLPDNRMAVVVVGSLLENVYYEGRFDPDQPQAPTCFAFGSTTAEQAPHQVVFDAGQAQSDVCRTCRHNEWGSAETGRGKACRNTRRVAMLPAGTLTKDGDLELIEDPAHYRQAQVGFMKLPVTSVKGYANYVRQVAGALKRPPHGIVTQVAVVPDPKTQFRVIFTPLQQLAGELISAVMERHKEVGGMIDFPYQLDTDEDTAPKPERRRRRVRRTS